MALNVINDSQVVRQSQCVGSDCSTTNPPSGIFTVQIGNTPLVRLAQSGTSWPAHTWDIAGNEANFFIRDVTGDNHLVFRVMPNTPHNSLVLAENGIGIGTQTPESRLHVKGVGAGLKVEDTGGTGPARVLADFSANGAPLIRLRDIGTNGTDWLLGAEGGSDFVIGSETGPAGRSFVVTEAGTATALGVLQQGADAAARADVKAVDPNQILTQLQRLPISTWTTAGDGTGARHLGPSGSDFRQAFGFGGSDLAIAPADMAAVGLAASKGLAERLARAEGRINAIDSGSLGAGGDAANAKSTASLRKKAKAQAKRIKTLTRRQNVTSKRLKSLERQLRALLRDRR